MNQDIKFPDSDYDRAKERAISFTAKQFNKTPMQDKYLEGKASFSDALNEFIEQGGNITKNGKAQCNFY